MYKGWQYRAQVSGMYAWQVTAFRKGGRNDVPGEILHSLCRCHQRATAGNKSFLFHLLLKLHGGQRTVLLKGLEIFFADRNHDTTVCKRIVSFRRRPSVHHHLARRRSGWCNNATWAHAEREHALP